MITDDTSVGIKDDLSGSSGNSVYSYKPILPCQGAYLEMLCSEEGIKAKMDYGRVRIYALSKMDRFKELIKQSIEDYKEKTDFQHPVHKWKTSAGIFCIGIAEEDRIYTYETAFHRVVCCRYIGVIPKTKETKIYSNRDEFLLAMVEKGLVSPMEV